MVTSRAPRQLREILRDGVVQGQLAFLRQQQDRGRGELLADGADGVLHLRRGLHGRRQPRQTICLEIGDAAILDDGNRGAGHFGGGQNLVDGGVDPGFRVFGELSTEGEREQGEEE